MNDSKTHILTAVKHALANVQDKATLPKLPVWGEAITNPVERFCFEWTRNDGELVANNVNLSKKDETIHKFLTESFHTESLWVSDESVCRGVWLDSFSKHFIGGEIDRESASRCDTAVCGCDLLLAETGTIAVSSQVGRPRTLTLLPPNVLFISLISQVVPKLEDALQKLAQQTPHGWVWISGPSRTADIEKVLVRGVHGPKRVAVLLLDDKLKGNE